LTVSDKDVLNIRKSSLHGSKIYIVTKLEVKHIENHL